MSYADSVGSLCVLYGFANPIKEEDLKIGRLIFFDDGEKIASIGVSEKNKGSRLFFQHKFSTSLFLVHEVELLVGFKQVAAEFYAEHWDDKLGDHPIIAALKQADTVQILWKP